MANESQQEQSAEIDQTTDIVDPLDALMDTQNNGTDNFSAYEAERAALLKTVTPEVIKQEQSAPTADEDEEQEEEEHASDEDEEEEQEEFADEDEEQEEEETAAPRKDVLRARLRRQDDIAIAELSRALDIPLLDAAKQFEAARAGTKSETQQVDDEPPARTYAQAKAELAAKIEEQAEAIDAVDFEAQKRLFREIEALRDELPDLKDAERQTKAQAMEREAEIVESVYLENEDKAFQYYPELKNPESKIYKRMAKIYRDAVALGDPIANDPERPWIMAKQAAKETGTLMTKPKADAEKPATKRKVSPFQPASGNGRTTTADATSAAKVIEGIDDLAAYERAVGRR